MLPMSSIMINASALHSHKSLPAEIKLACLNVVESFYFYFFLTENVVESVWFMPLLVSESIGEGGVM